METKKLGNYTLEILDIVDFKDYYYKNLNCFSTIASNSFLKALDIPPKFFKEQPEATQRELIENRDTFVRENKKYFGKVIIVLRADERILNACRMDGVEATKKYDMLSTIDSVSNKFEHRSFIKDGYISYIINNDIKNGVDNQVLAIDFPILLNKKPVIHEALYTLPNETFATPVEHIQYLSSEEIELGIDYSSIKDAIEDKIDYLTANLEEVEVENILRPVDIVSLALVEGKYIPKASRDKVENYISSNIETGVLTTQKLESLVLDFDETFNSYKQVTALRSIKGFEVLHLLESDSFKIVAEELDAELELLTI